MNLVGLRRLAPRHGASFKSGAEIVRVVLTWVGKCCNVLLWSGFYFVFPPDESNDEEMADYKRRLP